MPGDCEVDSTPSVGTLILKLFQVNIDRYQRQTLPLSSPSDFDGAEVSHQNLKGGVM